MGFILSGLNFIVTLTRHIAALTIDIFWGGIILKNFI
jgi:hypothetical protein